MRRRQWQWQLPFYGARQSGGAEHVAAVAARRSLHLNTLNQACACGPQLPLLANNLPSVVSLPLSFFPLPLQIVALGVDTYLKMLLEDNFVHTDLHPGNILVRPVGGGTMHHAGDPDPAAAGGAEAAAAAAGAVLAAAGAVAEEAGVEIVAPVRERHQPQPLQLVLLDFGLAEELTPAVRFHFISFLHYIAKGG